MVPTISHCGLNIFANILLYAATKTLCVSVCLYVCASLALCVSVPVRTCVPECMCVRLCLTACTRACVPVCVRACVCLCYFVIINLVVKLHQIALRGHQILFFSDQFHFTSLLLEERNLRGSAAVKDLL